MTPEARALLTKGLAALGLRGEQGDQADGGALLEALARYYDFLHEVNQQFNLTGLKDESVSVTKNLLDSLAPWRHVDVAEPLVEVGAGAGLPGIPLALALPVPRLILWESKAKKCRFLEQAIEREPALRDRASVRHADAADGSIHERHTQLVFRAFGPLTRITRVLRIRLAPGGRALIYKGRRDVVDKEIAALPQRWRAGAETHVVKVPGLADDEQRHLVILKMA